MASDSGGDKEVAGVLAYLAPPGFVDEGLCLRTSFPPGPGYSKGRSTEMRARQKLADRKYGNASSGEVRKIKLLNFTCFSTQGRADGLLGLILVLLGLSTVLLAEQATQRLVIPRGCARTVRSGSLPLVWQRTGAAAELEDFQIRTLPKWRA